MFPEPVLVAVKVATAANPGDISKATQEAEIAIRKLYTDKQLGEIFITSAIQELVYERRHQDNRDIKRAIGAYDSTRKVKQEESQAVQRVFESVYEYRIAGTILGDLLGEQLLPIADSEEAIANGHMANGTLLRKLRPMVRNGCKVRDEVSVRKLVNVFKQVKLESVGEPAA